MKKTKQLRFVTETVRSLVPGELSQINGGGILTEARNNPVGGNTGGPTTNAAPAGSGFTN